MTLQIIHDKPKNDDIRSLTYFIFGDCICCGMGFGIKKIELEKQNLTIYEFGCFIDNKDKEKCPFSGTDECKKTHCRITEEIKQDQTRQIKILFNKVLHTLMKKREVLFVLNYSFHVSREVYNRLIQKNHEMKVLARVVDVDREDKKLIIQFWGYNKEKNSVFSYANFPVLSPIPYCES